MRIANAGVLVIAAAVGLAASGCAKQEAARAPTTLGQRAVERGKYLADNVAMCTDCHTPRNEHGEFVASQWLEGSTLEFAPLHPMPAWSDAAPPIAGLVVYSGEHIATLLTTGFRPDGTSPRPPMPAYRMSKEDAEAIVAYLRSLGEGG